MLVGTQYFRKKRLEILLVSFGFVFSCGENSGELSFRSGGANISEAEDSSEGLNGEGDTVGNPQGLENEPDDSSKSEVSTSNMIEPPSSNSDQNLGSESLAPIPEKEASENEAMEEDGAVEDGDDDNENSSDPTLSEPLSKEGETEDESAVFKSCETALGGTDYPVKADVFELPPKTPKLPDFSTMTAVDTICMDNFDIPVRDFTEGFPGVKDLFEWFGLEAKTTLNVPADGMYSFKLSSDDGSKLYINGELLIDNDGTHSVQSKTGELELVQGPASLKIDYFQGPRTKIALQLFWKKPGDSEYTVVPSSVLSAED